MSKLNEMSGMSEELIESSISYIMSRNLTKNSHIMTVELRCVSINESNTESLIDFCKSKNIATLFISYDTMYIIGKNSDFLDFITEFIELYGRFIVTKVKFYFGNWLNNEENQKSQLKIIDQHEDIDLLINSILSTYNLSSDSIETEINKNDSSLLIECPLDKYDSIIANIYVEYSCILDKNFIIKFNRDKLFSSIMNDIRRNCFELKLKFNVDEMMNMFSPSYIIKNLRLNLNGTDINFNKSKILSYVSKRSNSVSKEILSNITDNFDLIWCGLYIYIY